MARSSVVAEEVVAVITEEEARLARALEGLRHPSASVRLRAALEVGTAARDSSVGVLIERCAVEPEFFVRDMLTWALVRHPAAVTVPGLVEALGSPGAQARSQALHTLSKIGDRGAWPAITRELLADADDTVARSAWRAAVVLVPPDGRGELARLLAAQFGRGGHETRLSLSRAFVALGEEALPAVRTAMTAPAPAVREHAIATERLVLDPDAGFEFALREARRIMVGG
ncbi:HEAT repeat domain-containing protein [Streptomyces racemochromogenes]|uniref:HEAT repeat domain-containing protein n=1 Tax=Streptomyces racemochromogenes TaxID=67353 RepID=A0ABW7PL78_9ACTN